MSAITASPERLTRIDPKFEVLPQSSSGIPSNGKNETREINLPPSLDKYTEQRKKMRSYVEKKGEILPPSHEFTQLIQRVSERLGVPEQAEIMALDTEDIDAFFHPESRTIVFSRGFARYFLERDLPLSEDHVAGVLGHELEHAHVIGDDYVDRIKSSYFERFKGMQNHAEEYRADGEATRRLSRAGYNPQAIVEMLRAFPLTHGRNDLGHPEQIERVRKLEDRLADDEHPLSNTTKEQTPIDKELLAWMAGDSTFYDRTEQLIHLSSEQLKALLLSTKSQIEFWSNYEVEQHIQTIGAAKELLAQNGNSVDRLYQKIMLLEALGASYLFQDGKTIQASRTIHDTQNKERFKKDEDGSSNYVLSGVITNALQSEKVSKSTAASEFRESVSRYNPSQDSINSSLAEINNYGQRLDSALKSIFDQLDTAQLTPEERRFINEMRDCYENGTITDSLFITAFSGFDLNFQKVQQQKAANEREEKGLRVSDQNSHNLYDFANKTTRSKFEEQVRLDLAISMIKDLPSPQTETINKLASIISTETGLPYEGANVVAQTMLLGKDAHAWDDYLKGQDKQSLTGIIKSSQEISEYGSLAWSPQRSLHQSYTSSISEVKWRKSYASGLDFNLDAGGLKVIKMLPGNTLYKKGWPAGFEEGWKRPSPTEINLTLDEWDAVVEGQGDHGAWSARDIFVLKQYVNQLKEGVPIDEELYKYLRKPFYANATESLNAEELQLLIEHSPWDTENLQRKIDAGIKHLPHKAQVSEERQAILRTLRLSYDLFKNEPLKRTENDEYWHISTLEIISSHMLDVLTQELGSGLPQNEAVLQAILQLSNQGVSLNYDTFSKEIKSYIWQLTDLNMKSLIGYFKQNNNLDDNQAELVDNLKILSQVSLRDRQTVVSKKPESSWSTYDPGFTGEIFCKESIQGIILNHGDNAVKWVIENLPPSERYIRDRFLVGLIDYAPDELRTKYIQDAEGNFTNSPDRHEARHSSSFPFESYYIQSSQINFRTPEYRDTVVGSFQGEGKLKEQFPDLLARRFPFATYAYAGHSPKHNGSRYQSFQARRLLESEYVLLDRSLPLERRKDALIKVAPYPSVVRDIHLELLLRDELSNSQNDQERIKAGNAFLSLFTEKSSLKGPLVIQVFRAELGANPQLMRDFNGYVGLITHYMPEPSLARNYFLNQFENSTPLAVEQLRQITAMRMSSEGKKTEDDSAPGTLAVSKLGELNREERVKATLWLLGISPDKPKAIIKMEKEFDGHLNNLSTAVAVSTDDEKEITYKRLLLGAEGIVDLETVKAEELPRAEAQRRELIKALANAMLPDSMPKADLFRNIFSTIIESSDPSHASRILTKLINRFSEAKVQGRELPPEEVIALGLNELGVIGKKVSQSLAELDWVPDSYKRTFRRAQSEGEVVPKRALLMLVEDIGLTDEDAPIKISSFDDLIGAASNKQAALLTVEVNDDKVGLPKGKHKVVGKFKRPSAQKTENINHDLRVLRSILEVLNKAGYGDTLPRDFSGQISDAVKRELEFTSEKQFSEEIRGDLNGRNAKRRFKVSIPNIYYASDDVMMESVAPGISLRQYKDFREAGYDKLLSSGYGALSERAIDQTVVTEALSQLITTGNIHADLHPGNIFVDQQGNLTLIDLGMHEKLNSGQRLNAISLIAGLATGSEAYVKEALKELGWDLGDVRLNLKRFKFAQNTTQLLRASQKTSSSPSELLGSIILATSKLTTYTEGFSNSELFKMLIGAVNKKEAPKIIAHLIQSGGRNFLRYTKDS